MRGFSHSQLEYYCNELLRLTKEKPMERIKSNKEDIMRLVEAQIAGGVDLSPEEMVDAAVLMAKKINEKLYEESTVQTR